MTSCIQCGSVDPRVVHGSCISRPNLKFHSENVRLYDQPENAVVRLSREEYLTEMVKLVAKRGSCNRAQVGCLIVRDGRVIVTGYNGSPPGEDHCCDVGCQMEEGHCIRTTHAEANAIAFAARYGIAIDGCEMVVYGWDSGVCHRCQKMAKSAGIAEITVIPLEK